MKRNILFLILTAFVFLSALFILPLRSEDSLSGGILDEKVNSNDEDYGAYLVYGEKEDTLYYTSSRPVKKHRTTAMPAEIFFCTRPSAMRNSAKINEGWSQAQQIMADASRISEFTRGSQTFSSDRIIFAAERDLSSSSSSGSSYLFDLWQMTKTLEGYGKPEPLSNVNDPDSWDSQPALSQDGKMLYFVSNRPGGKGGLDIWYSVLDQSGNWIAPQPCPNINTPGDEVSPHCGADGKFYFASNWDYKNNQKGTAGKDIFRCNYEPDPSGLTFPVNPVNLDEAIREDAKAYGLNLPDNMKYNSEKDDEFPYITPDRKFIFLTSNRSDAHAKRNIFAFSMPKSRIRLLVNVTEEILDANGNVLREPTLKLGLPLSLVDTELNTSKDIASGQETEVDAEKSYNVRFTSFVEKECYQNKISGPNNLTIRTKRPLGYDTLYVMDAAITRRKVEIPPIIYNSTDTLPYFITGYWYPNTSENLKEYRKRESAGFFNASGFIDSTGYDYSGAATKIDGNFDREIYKPLEKLLPAFQDFCRDTLYLKITIHGYTDPRGLSGGMEHPYRSQSKNKHNYSDETVTIGVDSRGTPVKINTGLDMWKWQWPIDPNNPNGKWVKLADEGQTGNILLSKLRAYYTFVTFDKMMQSRSPIYTQMRNNGRILLDAEGFGVDNEGFKTRKLKNDPQSRRIEIYLDVLRPEELAVHKRLPGGMLAEVKKRDAGSAKFVPKEADQKEAIKELPKVEKPDPTASQEKPQIVKAPGTQESRAEPEELKPEPEESKAEPEETKTEEIKTEAPSETKQVAQKPETKSETAIAEKVSEPLAKPEVKAEENREKPCYSIQYNTYSKFADADAAKKILVDARVSEVKIIEVLDMFGDRAYKLRSGCYVNDSDAIRALKAVDWSSKALGLPKKPVIVR